MVLETENPISQKRILEALCRQNLSAFVQKSFSIVNPGQTFSHNWHFDAISYQLTKIKSGENKRLLITLPPRSLKSLSTTIAFPAWILGHNPSERIITVSYAQDLAVAHAGSFRKLVSSLWYKNLFPNMRIDKLKDTETETRTTQGGYRLTTTIGGALTGRGGSIIIIDDPMKAGDAHSETTRKKVNTWYNETLLSRLDDKNTGSIILVMQRLHVNDLAGHILKSGGWEHLDLPAIAETDEIVPIGYNKTYHRKQGELLHEARENQYILDHLKASMGTQAFSAQYQQRPVPASGNMIKWKWFKTYDTPPEKKNYKTKIIQSWDTASKSHELADYSVGITAILQDECFYIVDVFRERLDYPELKKAMIALRKKWNADNILIEDKGSGIGLLQDLNDEHIYNIIGINPEGDKIVRMSTCSGVIEAGNVLLPHHAPWLDDFKNELLAFPEGAHDDQADALSQMINWNRTRSRYTLDNL